MLQSEKVKKAIEAVKRALLMLLADLEEYEASMDGGTP